MDFEDVYLVSTKLSLIDESEISDLEATLNIRVPLGYREFMTTLGDGAYCNELGVLTPSEILREYETSQDEWQDFYSWSEGEEILSKEDLLDCIIFGLTLDGDQLVYNPKLPDSVFVLPRYESAIYTVPNGFFDPLTWYTSNSEKVLRLPDFRFFSSYIDREFIVFTIDTLKYKLREVGEILARSINAHNEQWCTLEDGVLLLFLREINAQIYITGGSSDYTFADHVRIAYDTTYPEELDVLSQTLRDLHFYVQ